MRRKQGEPRSSSECQASSARPSRSAALSRPCRVRVPGLDSRPAGKADASTLAPALSEVVRRASPTVRALEVKSFEELLDPQVRPWRVGAPLFGLFGMIVVVVAAIGLFSVVSYLVTQRTHELGVRIALGAQRGQVVRLVMRGALRTAVVASVWPAWRATRLDPLLALRAD